MNIANLAGHFLNYFEVLPATTPELRRDVYRLRYDVYCREFGYESIADNPHGMESDVYDPHSLHVLVRHRASGLSAGCTRIIPAAPTSRLRQLPIEKLYPHKLDICRPSGQKLPRHAICEASRLCVHNRFRRRNGESASRLGDIGSLNCSRLEHRTFPLISVAISLATTALTELTRRPYMFAMMEPFLPRLLRRIGYEFIQAGDELDYHGKRAGYYVETGAVLGSYPQDILELYRTIREELAVLKQSAA
jgi:N-acyl amino acid synthase of PEP-CTERM/exosortase system